MEEIAKPLIRRRKRRGIELAMNAVFALAGMAAVAALVLEYGFREPIVDVRLLHLGEAAIVAVFVLDRIARLLLAERKWKYARDNAVDFVLMAVAAIVVTVNFETVLRAGALYVFITQAYILGALVLRGVSLNLRVAGSGIHPGLLLIGSFAFMIVVGSGLLMLPTAVHEEYYSNWYYDDALFTATSATCVTGLVVRDTGGHFTVFGQAIILAMVQCGGLGIMLFGTVLALLVGKALTLRQSDTIGQMLSTKGIGGIARLVAFVILITFAFEVAGAMLLQPMFAESLNTHGQPLTTAGSIWHAAFHSISAFCNAGFALYGNNMMQGVREGWSGPLRSNWQIMGVIAPLIVLGGVGFPVLQDCAKFAVAFIRRLWRRIRLSNAIAAALPPRAKLSLHSKIVLTTSIALVIVGAVVLLAVEWSDYDAQRVGRHQISDAGGSGGDWSGMPPSQRVREAVFQSITARTAGFNTIDMAELSNGGKLWMCVLMSIGGSPASTAGGMKTVTFALLLLVAWSQLRRRNEVEAFRRSIPLAMIGRAVSLAVLYTILVAVVTLGLCVVQGPGFRFIDLLFEACSACGTVGLSTGITGSLNVPGKLVVIAGMFIGRLGPLTLLAALTSRLRHVEYAYPSEPVIIG